MKRQIIKIDENLCNGCGECIPNCHEGALQIIDGKARLVSDLMCDGLGACIGHCPLGAISIEEREAEPYNETKVIAGMIEKGENTIFAHLKHLKDHKEFGFMKEGIRYLNEHRDELNFDMDKMLLRLAEEEQQEAKRNSCASGGCPGSAVMDYTTMDIDPNKSEAPVGNLSSALSHWPVQLHLINPASSHFQGTDLLIAADCTAFTAGGFHSEYLKGKTLAIACPKLDSGIDSYQDKIRRFIDEAKVNTITLLIMEVPCCGGLIQIIKNAMAQSTRKIPVKTIVMSTQGKKISENWTMY